MFPREAFRKILLNAVVHKDYASCNPNQIPGLFLLVPLAHENMLPGKGKRAVLPDADAEIGEEPDCGDSGQKG